MTIVIVIIFISNLILLVDSYQRVATMSSGRGKISSALSMSQGEVFDLVLEYLSTKGFQETASTLKKEATKKPSAGKDQRSSKQGSRLEDLLEKSYVTELASGEFLPR